MSDWLKDLDKDFGQCVMDYGGLFWLALFLAVLLVLAIALVKNFLSWLFPPCEPGPECRAVLKALDGEGWRLVAGSLWLGSTLWIDPGNWKVRVCGFGIGSTDICSRAERRLIRAKARETLARLIGEGK